MKIRFSEKFDVFSFLDYASVVANMRSWKKKNVVKIHEDPHYLWASHALGELRFLMEYPWDFDGEDYVSYKDYMAHDMYSLDTAILSAAAFDTGYWETNLMVGINYWLDNLDDGKSVLEGLWIRHHGALSGTLASMQWAMFGNFLTELCPAYAEYNDGNIEALDDTLQLLMGEVIRIAQIRHCYGLPTEKLPDLWKYPSKYVVPSSNDPFTVTKNAKGVVTVTDGALKVCMKLLSDRKHLVVDAWYSNGVKADLDNIQIRLTPAPDNKGLAFFATETPNLYQLQFGADVNCAGPCRLTYHYNKYVDFSF